MIFNTSIDKLSLGCGKEFYLTKESGNLFCSIDAKLCSSCQAQLTLLQNLSKQVEKIIYDISLGCYEWSKKDQKYMSLINKQKEELSKL